MIFIVTLIGSKNVGKSTLFNKLTNTNDSLVCHYPGSTIDRKYGFVNWNKNKFIIIDTLGIDNVSFFKKKENFYLIQQLLIPINESNIILFIVDGNTYPKDSDKNIINYLKKFKKNIILVINKINNINDFNFQKKFYILGIYTIVTIHTHYNYGINNLLKAIFFIFSNSKINNLSDQIDKLEIKQIINNKNNKILSPIKLGVIGRPNVGKSTFINKIIGDDRLVVHECPGTTQDSINIPIIINNKEYIIVDTAGIRKLNKIHKIIEKFSVNKTLKIIKDSNVILLMININEGVTNQDLSILNIILKKNKPLVILINKYDFKYHKKYKYIIEIINKKLNFIKFIRIYFISALYNLNVNKIFNLINEAYYFYNIQFSTCTISKIMLNAYNKYQPPIVNGIRAKLKYAHPGGYHPLIIVIHGTKLKFIPLSYKKYLLNFFYDSLKIKGNQIHLKFLL